MVIFSVYCLMNNSIKGKYSDFFERARELIQNTKNIFFLGGGITNSCVYF